MTTLGLLFLIENIVCLLISFAPVIEAVGNFIGILRNNTNGYQRVTSGSFAVISVAISSALLTLSMIAFNAYRYGPYTPPYADRLTYQLATIFLFGVPVVLTAASVVIWMNFTVFLWIAKRTDTSGEKYEEAVEESKKNQIKEVLKTLRLSMNLNW